MFAQIGLGERSGYGLESIHTTWKRQHWKRPALQEEFQPERTTLTLLPTSLLPNEIVSYIKGVLKDRFHLLLPDELLVLVTTYQEKSVTNVRLQDLTNKHSKEINKILSNLVEEGLLLPQGFGRGTTYILSDVFLVNEENMLSYSNKNIDDMTYSLGNNEEISGNNGGNLGNNEQIPTENKRLLEIAKPAREKSRLKPEVLRDLILSLCSNQFLTINELSYLLKRDSGGLRKNHIKELVEMNKLGPRYPNTPSHKSQAYKTVQNRDTGDRFIVPQNGH